MGISTIALYASPASNVCSAAHQMSSHASYDLDVCARSTSSASASPSQKPFVGGLSCLFSSSPIKSTCYSAGTEELGSLWHDRTDELGSSFRCSSLSSSLKRDQAHQSPVSVLQGLGNSIGTGSRSPPMRIAGDFSSIRSGSRGMFNVFVRRALGSYVDSDSSPLAVEAEDFNLSSSLNALSTDGLTFFMEGSFAVLNLPLYAKDLLSEAQMRHPIFKDDLVLKAFCEAEKAHRGQERASGHPYLQHCVETAVLLANIGAKPIVVAAGLLHDIVDDCTATYESISMSFGSPVAELVKGVSQLSHVSKLAREKNIASNTEEAGRLQTMFLAMRDTTAVLVKLADRLHNMLTLDALPFTKQQRFAKETLEIFAPLASRLGIFTWKEQLENLCFKHLNPGHYQELSSKLVDSFDEAVLSSSLEKLEQALKAGGISYHSVSGRHKSLYSIYSKMKKKKLNMDDIHDIHGLRLVVDTQEDCYRALKVVHQLWHEVPGRFKDYIVKPKVNGYQSLHTVVTGEGLLPFEVQIRTEEMHLQAEFGFAAHWRYKEGDCQHSSFVLQRVQWARWVISWQCEAVGSTCTFPTHSEDCKFSCKPHCDGPVFVAMIENDKMSVQEFSADTSVMNVLETAYRSSSSSSSTYVFPQNKDLRPRLNCKPVDDPSCKLKSCDLLELTPAIPDESLPEYREEIQRMYDSKLSPARS